MEPVYETPISSTDDQQTYTNLKTDAKSKKTFSLRNFTILKVVGAVIPLTLSVVALIIASTKTSYDRDNERLIQVLKEQLNDLKVKVEQKENNLNFTMETVGTLEMMEDKLDRINLSLSFHINSFHEEPVPATCPDNYLLNPFSNTCYGLVTKNKTWQEAKDYCEADGGYLATFETLESASWFLNLRKTLPAWGGSIVWLGGKRNADNTWAWHGRITEAFTFSIWAPGHPDNIGGVEDCFENRFDTPNKKPYYSFNDNTCLSKEFFFCEKN